MRTPKDFRKYQSKAIKFSKKRDASYLALDMGLGKTACALTVGVHWLNRCYAHAILYVAPINICLTVVEEEADQWSHLNHLNIVFLHGKDKESLLNEPADIYLINPEGIKWLHTILHKRLRWVRPTFPFSALIVDEGTKFKGRGVQWRKLKGMAPLFHKSIVMSGRPAPNSLLELWGQMFLLDQGKRLGKAYSIFRNRHFESDYMGFSWDIREGHDDIIHDKVKDIMFTVDKSVGGLPDIVTKEVKCILPPAAMRAYNTFKAKKIIEFKGNKLKAKNAMALTTKLRQFSQGLVYGDSDKVVNIHNEKYKSLRDIVDSANGKPVMVVYNFNHERDYLKTKFKDAPHIGGGVSKDDRKKILKKWNRGKIPLLLVHPKSTSHGLNMQFGSHLLVFYSPTFSGDEYHQLIARLCRIGQKHGYVIVYHLIAVGTIDTHVYQTIENKNATHQQLTRAILGYIDNGT